MKSTIQLDGSLNLVRVTVEGPGSLEECLTIIADLAARPDIRPGFKVLADARRLTFAPRLDESRRLADARQQTFSRPGPMAIVVTSDLVHGASRQFAALSELRGHPAAVFRDVLEAEAWLGVRARPGDAS